MKMGSEYIYEFEGKCFGRRTIIANNEAEADAIANTVKVFDVEWEIPARIEDYELLAKQAVSERED